MRKILVLLVFVLLNTLLVLGASVSNVDLSTPSGNNLTTENITVDYTSDASKEIINWYLDGSSIMALNMPFENEAFIGASSELLVDGDMEAEDTSAWLNNDGSGFLTKESTSSHGGLRNLKINVVASSGGKYPGAIQNILETGKKYKITGWSRSDGVTAPKVINTGNGLFETLPITTSWNYFEYDFMATDDSIVLYFIKIDPNGSEYVEFDDVSFKEIKSKDYASNNHGTIIGATWANNSGYDGKGAYSFEGNQYIDMNIGLINDSFSVSAWVKPLATTATYGSCIVCQDYMSFTNPAETMDGFGLYLSNENKFMMKLYTDTINKNAYSGSITYNQWYHLVGVYNTTSVCLYSNGNLQMCTAIDHSEYKEDIDGIVRIGNSPGDLNPLFQDWNGSIDDVQIYNIALSPEQITALYNNRTDLIVSQETAIDDVWYATVTPNDGIADGITVQSNSITILDENQGGGQEGAVPEFSDYAIMLLLVTTIGGFMVVKRR